MNGNYPATQISPNQAGIAPNPIQVPTASTNYYPTMDATTLQRMYQQRLNDVNAQTNAIYDANLAAQQQQLKSAYEQNLSDQEAARANIGSAYQTAANDLAIQYERNRRNLNEQAIANGINTGVGAQQRLSLGQQFNTSFGRLRGQEAGEMAESERQIANLKNSYQNQIAQAMADNDYQRAKALMDNYNAQQNWLDTQTNRYEDIAIRQGERAEDWAHTQQTRKEDQDIRACERQEDLNQRNQERAEDRQWAVEDRNFARQLEDAKIAASYGDFSQFEKLYGKSAAKTMKQTWIMQNPDLAWATGQITKSQYKKLTGKDPAGSSSGSSGSAGSGSGGSAGSGSGTKAAVGGVR